MMISTIPITAPLMVQAGYDSVWYGILLVLLIQTAMISPPFGINLFISSSYFKRPVTEVFWATVPWLVILLAVLAAITAWPDLSLWLVRASGIR